MKLHKIIKQMFLCIIVVLLAIFGFAACSNVGTDKLEDGVRFVPHCYWVDSENSYLSLSFYHTGKSFATTAAEIESCSIGNSSTKIDCSVDSFELSDTPLYTVEKTKYYLGRISIQPEGLNAPLGDAELFVTCKDGQSHHFPIGNIAFTAVDQPEFERASKFVSATIRGAMYFDNGKATTPVFAVSMQVDADVTLTRLASASDKFGFDLQNCKVCSYDEYAKTFEELVDNGQLDSKFPDIYRRKQVEKGEVTGAIELKAGEYVLLVPLVQYEKEIPEPIFSGIDIGFTAENESCLLHVNCNPLFSNNYHLEDEVTALFDKEQN